MYLLRPPVPRPTSLTLLEMVNIYKSPLSKHLTPEYVHTNLINEYYEKLAGVFLLLYNICTTRYLKLHLFFSVWLPLYNTCSTVFKCMVETGRHTNKHLTLHFVFVFCFFTCYWFPLILSS